MIKGLQVRLMKTQAWVFSLESIGVWTNLANVCKDQSDPFENSSLNFFAIFPRELGQHVQYPGQILL